MLEVLDLVSLCKSPTLLRVVEAGFTRNYRLYEGSRFVVRKYRNSWNNFLLFMETPEQWYHNLTKRNEGRNLIKMKVNLIFSLNGTV